MMINTQKMKLPEQNIQKCTLQQLRLTDHKQQKHKTTNNTQQQRTTNKQEPTTNKKQTTHNKQQATKLVDKGNSRGRIFGEPLIKGSPKIVPRQFPLSISFIVCCALFVVCCFLLFFVCVAPKLIDKGNCRERFLG